MTKSTYNLIVITGPTASGKTTVAATLAASINGEVISADSRQVYRGLNLGTGKDYSDYTVNGAIVPYHLIDIVDAGYQYNVFEFQNDFVNVFNNVLCRQKTPILCGGTGMYIEAVTQGYKLVNVPMNEQLHISLKYKTIDELAIILKAYNTVHNKSDLDTTKRAIRAIEIKEFQKHNPEISFEYPTIRPIIFGIRYNRETERKRITERLQNRLDCGMIDEVKLLLQSGVTAEQLMYYGLEYKYLTKHVIGEITYQQMFTELNTAIHQFAKRQMTWFRRMEKQGHEINWIDGETDLYSKIEIIKHLCGSL